LINGAKYRSLVPIIAVAFPLHTTHFPLLPTTFSLVIQQPDSSVVKSSEWMSLAYEKPIINAQISISESYLMRFSAFFQQAGTFFILLASSHHSQDSASFNLRIYNMDTRGVGVPFNRSPHLVSVPVLVSHLREEAIEES